MEKYWTSLESEGDKNSLCMIKNFLLSCWGNVPLFKLCMLHICTIVMSKREGWVEEVISTSVRWSVMKDVGLFHTTQVGGSPPTDIEAMVSHFLKKTTTTTNVSGKTTHFDWLSYFWWRHKKKMVLTVCSQESSMATNYIYIYLIFSHHLLICRHSFRQPVWLIQVKLDAFSPQVLLHKPTFHQHMHILILLISIFPGGSEIMSFS